MALLHPVLWFVFAALCSASVLQSPSAGGNFELVILHNNDMHARFEQTSQLSGACTTADREAGKCYGGFPRVAHVVKEARRAAASGEGPPVLYLNAGDTYTGTAWFTIYKWKIAAEFLNALQPDAVSLGNHEFDERIEGLVPFIRNVSTPVLAANLDLNNVPELLNEPNLHESIVLLINNVKIGVIGYLTAETKFLAPKNKVEYEDEVSAIRREIEKLKSQGVKIFIALGHSGFIKDVEIAKNVRDIDLVIGGHSNTFLWNGDSNEKPESVQGPYPVIIQQPSGRSVPIVQAYAYTKYLGKLNIVFDRQGEMVSLDGNPILLSQDIPEDKELIKIVNKYQNDVDRINKEAIGTSNVLLNGDQCRLRECNLGNFITDAIMNYTKTHHMDHYHDANIAIMQGGRIRTSIYHSDQPFKVTREDIITALPFSDQLSVVTMNGTVLLQALEHSVDTWRVIDSTGQFLQFTGVQVVYDLEQPPGTRVVEAHAVCSSCVNGKLDDIKADLTYKLVMPTFLAEGGDGFKIFESLPTEILPYNEVDCVIDYLKKYSPITPKVTDRVTLLNEGKVKVLTDNIQTLQSRIVESEHLQSSNQVSVNASVVNVIMLLSVIISLCYY